MSSSLSEIPSPRPHKWIVSGEENNDQRILLKPQLQNEMQSCEEPVMPAGYDDPIITVVFDKVHQAPNSHIHKSRLTDAGGLLASLAMNQDPLIQLSKEHDPVVFGAIKSYLYKKEISVPNNTSIDQILEITRSAHRFELDLFVYMCHCLTELNHFEKKIEYLLKAKDIVMLSEAPEEFIRFYWHSIGTCYEDLRGLLYEIRDRKNEFLGDDDCPVFKGMWRMAANQGMLLELVKVAAASVVTFGDDMNSLFRITLIWVGPMLTDSDFCNALKYIVFRLAPGYFNLSLQTWISSNCSKRAMRILAMALHDSYQFLRYPFLDPLPENSTYYIHYHTFGNFGEVKQEDLTREHYETIRRIYESLEQREELIIARYTLSHRIGTQLLPYPFSKPYTLPDEWIELPEKYQE